MDQPGMSRLHAVEQSTLSRCIRQLKERIQMIVFERSSCGVGATLAGREFLRAARSILEQMDMLVTTGHRTGRGEAGRLTIGFYTSLWNGANLAPCGMVFAADWQNLTRLAIRLQLLAILRFRPRAWRMPVAPEAFRVRRSGCRPHLWQLRKKPTTTIPPWRGRSEMLSGPRSVYACLLPIVWTSLDESFWLMELHRFVDLYTRIYFDDEGARTARSVAWMCACKATTRRSSSAPEVERQGTVTSAPLHRQLDGLVHRNIHRVNA